jgi:hypothetical protein
VAKSRQTRAVIVLDPSQAPSAHTLAAAHGVKVEQVPQRGIEPVTTVTLILVGTVAAVRAVQHILFEQRKGGQVIDLRPGAEEAFYRTPKLMYGIVVILASDGRVTVGVKEPDGMFAKVISTLPALLSSGDSAKQAAHIVTKTFGSDVQVDTAENPAAGGDV